MDSKPMEQNVAVATHSFKGKTPPIMDLDPKALADNILLAPSQFIASLSFSFAKLDDVKLNEILEHASQSFISFNTIKPKQYYSFTKLLQIDCIVGIMERVSVAIKKQIIDALLCIPSRTQYTQTTSSVLVDDKELELIAGRCIETVNTLGISSLLVEKLLTSFPSCPIPILKAAIISEECQLHNAISILCTAVSDPSELVSALSDVICNSKEVISSFSPLTGLQVALTTTTSSNPRHFISLMRCITVVFAPMIVKQQEEEKRRQEKIGEEQEDREKQGLDPSLILSQDITHTNGTMVLIGEVLGIMQDLLFSNNVIVQSQVAAFVKAFTSNTLFGMAVSQLVKSKLQYSDWFSNCPAFVVIALLLLDHTDEGVLSMARCLMDEDRSVRLMSVLVMLQLQNSQGNLLAESHFAELADVFKEYATELVSELLSSSQTPRVGAILPQATIDARIHAFDMLCACNLYDHIALSLALDDAMNDNRALAAAALKYIISDGLVAMSIDRTKLCCSFLKDLISQENSDLWRQSFVLDFLAGTNKWSISLRQDVPIAMSLAWRLHNENLKTKFDVLMKKRFIVLNEDLQPTSLTVSIADQLTQSIFSNLVIAGSDSDRIAILHRVTSLAHILRFSSSVNKRHIMQVLQVFLDGDVRLRASSLISAHALNILDTHIFDVAIANVHTSVEMLKNACVLFIFTYASTHIPRLSKDQKLSIMEVATSILSTNDDVPTEIISACLKFLWVLCDSFKRLNGVDEFDIKPKLIEFITFRLSKFPTIVQRQAFVFVSHVFSFTPMDASLLLSSFRSSRGTVKSSARNTLNRSVIVECLEMLDIRTLEQAIALVKMSAKDPRFAVATASSLFRYAVAETAMSLGTKWDNAMKELKKQNPVVAALLAEAYLVCGSLWEQPVASYLVQVGLKDPVKAKRTDNTPKKPKRRQLPSAPSPTKRPSSLKFPPQPPTTPEDPRIEELEEELASLQQELQYVKEDLKEERRIRLLLEHENEDISSRLGATQAHIIARERAMAVAKSPAPPKPARKSQKSKLGTDSAQNSFKLSSKALLSMNDKTTPLLVMLRNWESRHGYRLKMIRAVSNAISSTDLKMATSDDVSLLAQWHFSLNLVVGVINCIVASLTNLLTRHGMPTVVEATNILVKFMPGVAAVSELSSLSLRLVHQNVSISQVTWGLIEEKASKQVAKDVAVPTSFHDVLSFGADEHVFWGELLGNLAEQSETDADMTFLQSAKQQESQISAMGTFSICDDKLSRLQTLLHQNVFSSPLAPSSYLVCEWFVRLVPSSNGNNAATTSAGNRTSVATMAKLEEKEGMLFLLCDCIVVCNVDDTATIARTKRILKLENEETGTKGKVEIDDTFPLNLKEVARIQLDSLQMVSTGLGLSMLSFTDKSNQGHGTCCIIRGKSEEDLTEINEAVSIQASVVLSSSCK
eukprot:m.55824 g.55824  ORF g.55824 m.55824 type:complete len:1432 (-) comp7774_c0_seq1:193-4488(-)